MEPHPATDPTSPRGLRSPRSATDPPSPRRPEVSPTTPMSFNPLLSPRSPARAAGGSIPSNNVIEPISPSKRVRTSRTILTHTVRRDNAFWMTETIGLLIGLGTLVAIVAVFAHFQGQLKDAWEATITPNALIAALSVVMKIALAVPLVRGFEELKWIFTDGPRSALELSRFDRASNPWGAFLLLFKNFGFVARLGAVLVLLNIAIDPFMQQTLHYDQCGVQRGFEDAKAYIPRTNHFHIHGMTSGQQAENTIDTEFERSFYQGILFPPANSTDKVEFQCGGENCTFGEPGKPAYNSVALCFDMANLTSAIQKNGSGSSTNYSIPNSNLWVGPEGRIVSANATGSLLNTSAHWDITVFSFEIIMMTKDLQPVAFGASYYPCVHMYDNASIINGTLFENIVKTTSLVRVNASDPTSNLTLVGNFPGIVGVDRGEDRPVGEDAEHDHPSAADIDCTPAKVPTGTKTVLSLPGNNTNSAGNRGFLQGPEPPGLNPADIEYYDSRCSYLFHGNILQSIQPLSNTLFGPAQYLTNTSSTNSQLLVDGPLQLRSLYGDGTMDMTKAQAFLQGIADATTADIRNNHGDTDDLENAWADGIEIDLDICIYVQWGWLALPALVAGCTLIFFLATVFLSHRSGRGRAPRDVPDYVYGGGNSALNTPHSATRFNQGGFDEKEAVDSSGTGDTFSPRGI